MENRSIIASLSGLCNTMRVVPFVVCLSSLSFSAVAGPKEQANRLHQRLTGVPATKEVRDQMETLISNGQQIEAALLAIEDENFYDNILKNWVKPWTNEEHSVKVPLTDYVATVIGVIRDETDFREILSGDIVYTAQNSGLNLPAYSIDSNDHYEQLEQAIDNDGTSLKTALSAQSQSQLSGGVLPANATAGILTSRAAAEAFLVAGTNRAQFAYTFRDHMCREMETMGDASGPTDRIRKDVERNPAGDSTLFNTYCVKCHSQMDGNVGAWAYYDWDEEANQIIYSQGTVRPKYSINANAFPEGYTTTDDSWVNYMRLGTNMTMGFDSQLPGSGNGAKSWGQEIANSDEFARCQVQKAFKATCLSNPESGMDKVAVERIAEVFKSSGYNMKRVFAETAVHCMGE